MISPLVRLEKLYTSQSPAQAMSRAPPDLLLLQIETSEGGEGEPPLCAGCRIRIQDKYYLCAVEKKWHSSCLKCAECGAELENEASCFEKEGQIYCRDDYLRCS